MVDTAGTLMQAAKALKLNGAKSVIACCTHGVLSDNAGSKIEQSEIEELLITDTIKLDRKYKNITILSVDDLIANSIKHLATI
jgi:ribose-phosphate pyrophosphokinase